MDYSDVYDFILRNEIAYKLPIYLYDSWKWSMLEHIKTSDLYKHSQLKNEKGEFTPVKNITRPILNLQYRTEDIEVKDVQLYVNEPDRYHLSFLVKKFHDEVFVQKYDLDTFFDNLNISRIDMGGGLSKKLYGPCPEVVPLQSIAFCDQTDMLSGPIALKHFYSPDQLLDMAKVGWGDPKKGANITLDRLIVLAREEKKEKKEGQTNKTPGKYIEIYELHGNVPKRFANPADTSGLYESRIFIVGFYQDKQSDKRKGVTLYSAPETTSPFKLIKRDPVYGRALGFGGAEELFEPQVWINYDVIRMNDMLDAASKTILKATGSKAGEIAKRTKVKDMDNLEIIDVGPDGDLQQIDTFPRNLKLFESSVAEWEAHAQQMGAANDSIMGEPPTSGTPFKLQELVSAESHGLHDWRRGQFAKHLEEIYRDWIIPYIEKEITKGTTFLAELSLEELQMVGENLATNEANKQAKKAILAGEMVTPEMVAAYKQQVLTDFQKKGNKHFIEILKGEFDDTSLSVKVDIAGKSKDLSGMVDKLTNVFRTIIANPYILQAPPIAKLFNKIIEASGLDPIDLSNFNVPPLPTRRITTNINYADLGNQPNPEQQEVLALSGVQPPQGQGGAQATPMPAK